MIALTDVDRQPPSPALIRRLPAGSWIIIRDYHRGPTARRAHLAPLIPAIRRGRIRLAIGCCDDGSDRAIARAVGADAHHLRDRAVRRSTFARKTMLTMAAHRPAAIHRARQMRAALILISPLFATDSHPGSNPLGLHRWARLAAQAPATTRIALGGVKPRDIGRLSRHHLIDGIAGIGLFARRR